MKTVIQKVSNRTILIWVTVFLAGLLLVGATFLPVLNPSQCPDAYTQAEVDASQCIIGANIGAGLIRLTALALVIAGSIGLLLSLFARLMSSSRK